MVPADQTIRSGYSANAAVTLSEVNGVVSLPEGVLEFEGDKAYV